MVQEEKGMLLRGCSSTTCVRMSRSILYYIKNIDICTKIKSQKVFEVGVFYFLIFCTPGPKKTLQKKCPSMSFGKIKPEHRHSEKIDLGNSAHELPYDKMLTTYLVYTLYSYVYRTYWFESNLLGQKRLKGLCLYTVHSFLLFFIYSSLPQPAFVLDPCGVMSESYLFRRKIIEYSTTIHEDSYNCIYQNTKLY